MPVVVLLVGAKRMSGSRHVDTIFVKSIFFVGENNKNRRKFASADFSFLFIVIVCHWVVYMAHKVTEDEEDDYMSDSLLAKW